MAFLQRTPFFRLLLALVSGIVLFQYIRIPIPILAGVFLCSLFVPILFLFIRNAEIQFRFGKILGTSILVSFLAFGYGTCLFFERQNEFSALNQRGIYEVELTSAPVSKERSYSFQVKLIHLFDSTGVVDVSGNAIIYIQKDSVPPPLLLGDRILVETEFKTPDGVQNPNGFDYAAYLKRQGVGATSYIATEKWTKIDRTPSFSITRVANQCRNSLLEIYRKYNVDGEEFAVLAALTLGFTDSLEPDLYKLYSHTGAVHILSVSGLHVGIVYLAIFTLLGFLGKSRKGQVARAIISILFIWIYAIITGLSPAVLRAAMMMSFVALGTCLNRNSQVYNTVLLSAFVILIFNPNLLFNIGFQLSYLAVLSIVIFQPMLSRLYTPTHKGLKWFRDLTTVSLAAQLGTAPISIYYFHQFPNYFLLTNFVAIPLSTVIIYLAILLLFISFVPLIASWVGFMLKWSIWLMNRSLEVIVELPASISEISITPIQLFCILGALILLTAFLFNKKFLSLSLGLGFTFVFAVIFAFRQYESLQNHQLIVFSDSKTPIVNFIQGKNNYVYTLDESKAISVGSAFWQTSLLHAPRFINGEDWFGNRSVLYEGKRILILDEDWLRYKTVETPIDVDYLILTNRIKPRMNDILNCVKPKLVIVDKSISQWYTNHVKEVCATQKIEFYSIAEKGAFIKKFGDGVK